MEVFRHLKFKGLGVDYPLGPSTYPIRLSVESVNVMLKVDQT